jgi:hypothetical protein
MSAATSVTANFGLQSFALTVSSRRRRTWHRHQRARRHQLRHDLLGRVQ